MRDYVDRVVLYWDDAEHQWVIRGWGIDGQTIDVRSSVKLQDLDIEDLDTALRRARDQFPGAKFAACGTGKSLIDRLSLSIAIRRLPSHGTLRLGRNGYFSWKGL